MAIPTDSDLEVPAQPQVPGYGPGEDLSGNPYASSYPTASPLPPPGRRAFEPADRSPIVLTLGVISVLASLVSCGCCIVFPIGLGTGIPAWVMASKDLREIQQGRRNPCQGSVLQAGRTCGIIGVSLASAILVLRLGYMLLQVGVFGF